MKAGDICFDLVYGQATIAEIDKTLGVCFVTLQTDNVFRITSTKSGLEDDGWVFL